MNKKILKLAIPNIITNLTVPLLSSVDTALMGHLGEAYYLGAIAVGGMIFNFIYWGFGFLRMGTTGLTAQAYGKKDDRESIFTLARALTTAIGFSLLVIVLKDVIIEISFLIITSTPEVESYARDYFFIRILAAPATLSLYVFTGWFLGMQNAKYPLILAVMTNSLNIIFNLIFVKVYAMNVDGVAIGTVLATYSGLLTAVALFYVSYKRLLRQFNFRSIFDWASFNRFFRIGRDIFIRTMILVFAFSFFTAKSAESGDLILAANSILINLWTIMSYGIDGFAFAAESLIGRYYGAKDVRQLKSAVNHSFLWGTGLGLVFSLAYSLFALPILKIFTDNQRVIMLAIQLMFWTKIAPVISSVCYLWDGVFIGATATTAMRNMMFISLFVFYLPIYFVFREFLADHALWVALTVFMMSRGVLLTLQYPREILKKFR